MDSGDNILIEQGLLFASESAWSHARLRTELIAPLAQLKIVSVEVADNTASKLGISRRQVYRLIKRYHRSSPKNAVNSHQFIPLSPVFNYSIC